LYHRKPCKTKQINLYSVSKAKENRTIKTVFLVTGTPGTGKTTVSHKLAAKLGAHYIGITELVKSEKLFTGTDESRNTLVADSDKVSKKLQEITSEIEGIIIIDGHYASDVVPNPVVSKAFVLRRDPRDLKKTLEERGYNENKVHENLAAEILDVCLWETISDCGINKVCEIDISNKTSDESVQEILGVIDNKKQCKVGIVDWLGALEKAGQLQNYLKTSGLSERS
jgi:adenylate kinase